MGCDGGTIPTRDELVRLKKKPERKDKVAETATKWKNCALSQQPLRQPVLCCELGRLFNKESLIEYLLNKEAGTEISRHIRNLKDVVELKLTPNKDFRGNSAKYGDSYIDTQKAQYICPIAGIEMNGTYKFCVLWKCGCVLSDRALKAVKSEVCLKSLLKCGGKFDKEDIIVINPADEDLKLSVERMKQRQLKSKMEKKQNKTTSKRKAEQVQNTKEEKNASASKSKKIIRS
ncbi:Protein RTF2 [Nymphon striatum]|nr:Protein RTF2 [Nymphon striatum]